MHTCPVIPPFFKCPRWVRVEVSNEIIKRPLAVVKDGIRQDYVVNMLHELCILSRPFLWSEVTSAAFDELWVRGSVGPGTGRINITVPERSMNVVLKF